MDVLAALLISLFFMISAVLNGFFLGFPLSISLIMFAFILHRRGFTWKRIYDMGIAGSKHGLPVVLTFILIGAITASWLAAGTIAYLVSLALQLLQPEFFLLSAFWLCCLVSFALGTSFGTCSTVGLVLIVLARSGHVDLSMTAGAIISGIYFGDRASPMSSALSLLSTLTKTNVYSNVGIMLRSSLVPFGLASIAFGILSPTQPLQSFNSTLPNLLAETFKLDWVVLLPAVLIFGLCILRFPVKKAMGISVVSAIAVACFFQGVAPLDIARQLVFGFSLPSSDALAGVFKGGGIFSMLQTSYIILVATAISGLFDQGGLLDSLRPFVAKAKTRTGLYARTLAVAILTAAFGCNQAISIIMTTETMQPIYAGHKLSASALVHDVSLAAFLVPGMIPWNIASLVPLTTLDQVGMASLPFNFFLIFGALYFLVQSVFMDKAELEIAEHAMK